MGARRLALAAAAVGAVLACSLWNGTPPPPPDPEVPPDENPPSTIVVDAGNPPPPIDDAGNDPDSGDTAATLPGDGPIDEAGGDGWTFVSSGGRAYGAAVDAAGNLYVAAGDSLAVRRASESGFRHHGLPQNGISVAAGAAGVAYVGYEGTADCDYAWDTGGPASSYKSGDADRIVLTGDGIDRQHYDIYSGPGVVPAEPAGREKLCTIVRILYDPLTRNVWFGGNHGVAWGDPDSTRVIEHTHPAINAYWAAPDGSLHYTLISGWYYGLAADEHGDLWLGGTERSAHFPAANPADFWTADIVIQREKLDLWPDAVPEDPRPEQRVDDYTMGLAPTAGGGVWAGSLYHGVAYRGPGGDLHYWTAPLIDVQVTAVRLDPLDGSVWFGQASGGITRLKDNRWMHYTSSALGAHAGSRVWDIQVDSSGSRRRMIVAFGDGTVGLYSGD